jgi:hypothetical protein
MNVVAVAAIGLNAANFAHLATNPRDAAFGVAFLAATSVVVALSLGDFCRAAWPKGLLESAWLALIVFTVVAIPADGPSQALGACVFVGAWVITQKLDNQQVGKPVHRLRVV